MKVTVSMKELRDKDATIAALREEVERLVAEMDILRAEPHAGRLCFDMSHSNLRAEVEGLKAKLQTAYESYEGVCFDKNAMKARAEQAEKAHDALHKQYSDLDIAMREAEKELAELQGKRNTAYSYIEDVLIGSPYEWAGKRLLEMIGDKK